MSSPRTWEEALGPLLRAADPAAARAALLLDSALPDGLRAELLAVDPAGLRVLALLAARLRFDRLMNTNPEARARYAADPGGWAAAFRAWHADTPVGEGDVGP